MRPRCSRRAPRAVVVGVARARPRRDAARRHRSRLQPGATARGACLLLLLAVNVRAAEPQRLTHDGRLKFSPVFCDGGESIVYVELESPELYRLKRLRLADGTIEPVHENAPASQFEPAYSADGSRFAFLNTRGALSVSVVVRDLASGAETEIPPGEGFSGLRSPALSPDGRTVAFAYAEGGVLRIDAVDVTDGERRTLTGGQGLNNWPGWSPDGGRIVFASTRDGDYEIYSMAAGGDDVLRLTHSERQDIRPRYSPDGGRIAFVSHRDGNAEVYVVDADGGDVRRVTSHDERDDYPDWHPDGRRIVVVCERDGEHDLYLIDVP